MLDDAESRCMGIFSGFFGDMRCVKRSTCARYLDRHDRGEETKVAMWMCPGPNDYWEFHVPREPHASAATT